MMCHFISYSFIFTFPRDILSLFFLTVYNPGPTHPPKKPPPPKPKRLMPPRPMNQPPQGPGWKDFAHDEKEEQNYEANAEANAEANVGAGTGAKAQAKVNVKKAGPYGADYSNRIKPWKSDPQDLEESDEMDVGDSDEDSDTDEESTAVEDEDLETKTAKGQKSFDEMENEVFMKSKETEAGLDQGKTSYEYAESK